MMLVARMIMAKPSAIRLYTQPIASPPTMRSTNSETLRAPIASPCVQGRGSTECFEEAGTERLVHPTVRCEWAGGPHEGIGDRSRRFPLARTRFRGRCGSHSIGARKARPEQTLPTTPTHRPGIFTLWSPFRRFHQRL